MNAVDLAALYNRALSLRAILHYLKDLGHVQMALRVWGRRDPRCCGFEIVVHDRPLTFLSRYGICVDHSSGDDEGSSSTPPRSPHDRWRPEHHSPEYSKTPLQIACEANNAEVVRVLLSV